MSPKEIKEMLELDLQEGMQNRNWGIMPCSAITGDGLLDGMNWMVNDIKARIFMMD